MHLKTQVKYNYYWFIWPWRVVTRSRSFFILLALVRFLLKTNDWQDAFLCASEVGFHWKLKIHNHRTVWADQCSSQNYSLFSFGNIHEKLFKISILCNLKPFFKRLFISNGTKRTHCPSENRSQKTAESLSWRPTRWCWYSQSLQTTSSLTPTAYSF